jgi:hypothetical protein
MTSLLSPPGSGRPVLPDMVFRRRLEAVRDRLAGLERRAPAGHVAAVADVTEFIEDLLVTLGWEPPPPPPLTQHDQEVLAAVDDARHG